LVEKIKIDNRYQLFTSKKESSTSLERPSIPVSFPQRYVQKNKKLEEVDKEILKTYRNIAVKIHVLDIIKHIPKVCQIFKGPLHI